MEFNRITRVSVCMMTVTNVEREMMIIEEGKSLSDHEP